MNFDNFRKWPCFTDEEADAVSRVLLSNKVNAWTGNECAAFEEEFASFFGPRHAIATANGTLALELALKALNLTQEDEVIVTARSFVATASCVVNIGAVPIFADVCPDSGNITAETIAPLITAKTRAIICVHLAGWPCDMPAIQSLASTHGVAIIEDCAQAHGARIGDRSVGLFSDMAAWSFCQDKIMTTGGEGGMISTNNTALADRIRSLKDHGKNIRKISELPADNMFKYVHDSFGTNARMTEMQAAIGRIQLQRMPEWSRRRQQHAQTIWQRASVLPGLRVPSIPATLTHAAYKCYLYLQPDALSEGWDRRRIIGELNQAGIPCQTGACPEIYLERAFVEAGLSPQLPLQNATQLGQTSIMLPVHPTLSDDDIHGCCDTLEKVMLDASR